MYKSPLIFDKRPDQGVIDLCERMAQEALDMAVGEQVSQLVGIRVDAVELRKALNYDRDMYNKGYQDGVEYAKHKQVEAEWEPEKKEEPKPEKPKPEGYGECWACRYAAWDGKEKDWLCNSVVLCTGGQCWKSRKVEEDG